VEGGKTMRRDGGMTNLGTQQHDQFNHRTAGLHTHKTCKK